MTEERNPEQRAFQSVKLLCRLQIMEGLAVYLHGVGCECIVSYMNLCTSRCMLQVMIHIIAARNVFSDEAVTRTISCE